MRAVNLLPSEQAAARAAGGSKVVLLLAAGTLPVLAGAAVYIGYTYEHDSVTSRRGELAALDARIAPHVKLWPRPRLAAPAPSLAQRTTTFDSVLAEELPWALDLRQVARVLPSNVWLTSMSFATPTPADMPPPAPAPATTTSSSAATTTTPAPSTQQPDGFMINGYTYSHGAVADLLARLQLLPSLSNVSLASTSEATINDTSLIQFQVNAVVNPPSAAGAT